MKIIDLSMPIAPHFRWPVELSIKGDIASGDQFRVSKIAGPCHGFSHVDAAAHFVAGAPTIETTPLSQVVGACRVLDLSARPANAPIEPEHLAAADPGGKEGEILLLAAHWNDRRDHQDKSFWTEAPWLTLESAQWLAARKPSAVAFDFPQDYPIRLLLEGKEVPKPEHVTHHVLLSHGVTLIEYVCNTSRLSAPRNLFSAAPLLIPNADGAPARFYAIEGLPV
ncbi:cyclase family protein [Bosea sp. (in: a-proteobacteria)]|jgi:kynurenine formamidase|uniref:cyclase family protein n=1 Tax=Bosea sp. (in: a-proteobacteria) TaxID=1871050 RepID=UPI000868DCA8|nr:cyclase family protein [Bosea sp. (in: a-proteobacteria)]MBN9437753.1 cyclase family protein [Bosea sp. (in: a-proteobacteria)]ODT54883.1 MAG: cyclase [Methylobacterium sp. SCN 67-24]